MNLSTLRTRAQRLAGRVDTDYNDRTTEWLNEAQELWASEVPWDGLKRIEDFTVAASTQNFVLPHRVWQVNWLGDKTNRIHIRPHRQPDRAYPKQYFNQDSKGQVDFFRRIGLVAVTSQPATPSYLQFNTTASDVFNVYIAGLGQDTTASGTANEFYEIEEQLSLGDTSTVTTTNQYYRVDAVGKDKLSAGDVIGKIGTTPVVRVAAHEWRSEYTVVEFTQRSDKSFTLQAEYLLRPRRLVESYQTPNPDIDINYLIHYAAAKIHESQQQDQLAQLRLTHAERILQKRAKRDEQFGDRDFQIMPEPGYWRDENQYSWEPGESV